MVLMVSDHPHSPLQTCDPPGWASEAVFPEDDAVVILPEVVEEGAGIYRAEVESLVKLIRHEGADARFLHEKESRSYRVLLGETEISFMLSVAASLVGSAAWALAVAGIRRWLSDADVRTLRLRVRVRRVNGDSAWFKARGDAEKVVEALTQLGELLEDDTDDGADE
jgi:hypothetical protein